AEGGLTARRTGRAGTKVGLSDPTFLSGRSVAQRIKATPGITGLSCPRVHIDGKVWHLDVGSSHPGAGVGPKGWAVRPLKRHASWVQNVARQFGLYPSQAQERCGASLPVREDRSGRTAGGPVGGPPPPLDSHVRTGEALNASKREAAPKMSVPWMAPAILKTPGRSPGTEGAGLRAATHSPKRSSWSYGLASCHASIASR